MMRQQQHTSPVNAVPFGPICQMSFGPISRMHPANDAELDPGAPGDLWPSPVDLAKRPGTAERLSALLNG